MSLNYSFRPNLIAKEETFTLDSGRLAISDRGTIAFSDIREIRTYDYPGATLAGGAQIAPGAKRCVIHLKSGRAVVLVSNHLIAAGSFEDRSATYDPFVAALIHEVSAANAATIFISGMPTALWIGWIVIVAMAFLMVPLLILAIIGTILDGKWISPGMIIPTLFLLGIVIGVRPLLRTLRRNWPRRYDPRVASVAS